jgi:chromosome segregation protein
VHLSAVRIRGFKSFPDPVEVRLEPGVAVVVGPNGSGKSNVSDAIVWAAGSLSPTELRAEKPDDVLFGGGHGRDPADFCEVELLFDNSDGGAPIDYAELSVARRLHRGGEGRYLLNGTTVRRLDVVELLSDVGLGAGMHSIVGQGKVEEILAASPERRREMVEEAAGLGRFKRQRHRAELKLARVAVDVARAKDLEAEVRARLRPLALQASAAERAERLAGEIASLRARVAELDLEDAEARRQAAEDRRAAAALARRLADERLGAVLEERGRAEEELADAAGRREQATALLYRVRNGRERLSLRRESAETLLSGLGEQADEARRQAPGLDELRRAREALAAAAAEHDDALARQAAAVSAAREAARQELATVGAQREAGEAELAGAVEARESVRETLHRLRAARERLALRAEGARTLHEGAVTALADARESAAAAPERERLEAEADRLAAEARGAAGERDALTERTRVAKERLSVVERALAEAEGLPPAARALAEEGGELLLATLDVPPGEERATAAALGWRASALVAGDPAEGFALLERARRAGLGSVTVVVGLRAASLARSARVVPADELLAAGTRAVTPEGHGYDPGSGELWYVGESAEAVVLELEARRRELAAESAELAASAANAGERAERAAAQAAEGDRALRKLPARPPGRGLDPELLARLAAAAERLAGALAAGRAHGDAVAARLEPRATAAVSRADDLAEALRRLARHEVELRTSVDAPAANEGAFGPVEAAAARVAETAEQLRLLEARFERLRRAEEAAEGDVARLTARLVETLSAAARGAERFEAPLRARADAGGVRTQEIADALRRLAEVEVELRRAAADAGEGVAAADVELARVEADSAAARRRLEEAAATAADGDDRDALATRIERLERRHEELGRVNPFAREEYERERERLEELTAQRTDLDASLAELERLRDDLGATVERRFAETFAAVAEHFERVAATLFPGGEGRLRLVASDDEAEGPGGPAVVELELRPAGKRVTRLSLLSGGEKALAAISFLFALFLARPSPFYVLDEVEAALDDTNIGRFVDLLRRYSERAQFVVVTHQKRTIEAADVLYGVTMGPDGVSQVVSRRLPQEDRAVLAAS